MLDDVDRGLVHALHLDGRVPFGRVADVLGVSTQTVTRRYQRLRRDAGLRVVALPGPERTGTRWMVRLTAAPSTAGDLAQSLARRPDTSWVRLVSGGTEIVAVVTAGGDGPSLLLHDVPRTSSVTAVSAHAVLHTYLGGPTSWPGRARALTPDQQRRIAGQPVARVAGVPEPDGDGPAASPGAGGDPGDPGEPPGPGERRMLAVLARDGRAPVVELAAATGWSPATTARRLAALRRRGAVFLDVDLDDAVLGVGTRALLWIEVAPRDLDRTARALARHDDLAFVATITGAHSLVAQALAAGPRDLHDYLTGPLAALDGVRRVETTPVLRTVKTTGPLP